MKFDAKKMAVGDKLAFGRYPQGADGGIAPLHWLVRAVRDGHALLLADRLIECLPYHASDHDTTWADCSLRAWLGGEFFIAAFDENERGRIARAGCENAPNPSSGAGGSEPTRDSVFLLSLDEYRACFSLTDDHKVYATPYAVRNAPKGGLQWWLRTAGDSPRYAACVHYLGGVSTFGSPVEDTAIGVRPALWLRLS